MSATLQDEVSKSKATPAVDWCERVDRDAISGAVEAVIGDPPVTLLHCRSCDVSLVHFVSTLPEIGIPTCQNVPYPWQPKRVCGKALIQTFVMNFSTYKELREKARVLEAQLRRRATPRHRRSR